MAFEEGSTGSKRVSYIAIWKKTFQGCLMCLKDVRVVTCPQESEQGRGWGVEGDKVGHKSNVVIRTLMFNWGEMGNHTQFSVKECHLVHILRPSLQVLC